MNKSEDRRLVGIFEDITSRLLASTEPNRLYDAAVEIAMQTTGAQACSLYLEQNVTDPEREPVRIVMVSGAGFEMHRIGVTYEKGEGLTGNIWKNSKSVKLDSKKEIEDPKNGWSGLHNKQVSEKVEGWQSYSLIGVPLRTGNRTIGVLKVENKQPDQPSCFSTDDQILLETIASTIAMAIENQRSFEKSHGVILDALRDMTGMLVNPEVISFRMMCDRIVQKCIDIFTADACSLYIQDEKEPEYIEMVSGAGYEKYRRGIRYQKEEGLTGTIWAKGEAVKYDSKKEVENKANGWSGQHNDRVRNQNPEWECCSLIGVPLRIGTRTIGVLKVENKKPVKVSHFTHNELRTLAIVASNIALALEMRKQEEVIFTKGERARDFTHDVTNEVGTAEDALNAAVDAAKKSGAPELVVERIKIASAAMKSIEEMRKRLLEDSRSTPRKSSVSINELIRRAAERGNSLKGFGIDVQVKLLEKDVYAQMEEGEVLRAFDKLLENATDAIREAENRIVPPFNVWIIGQFEENQSARLKKATVQVVDNGPGFETGQRIEFERNKDIKSTKHDGFGRGIAIAHRCLADNEIYLRIIDPPADLTKHGAAFELSIPINQNKPLRALLIDDQETWLSLVKSKVTEDPTIKIETNTSYDKLWEAVNGSMQAKTTLSEFDIILLDCHFTGQPYEGPELVERLQASLPDIARKVVLMSREKDYLDRRDVHVINKVDDVLNKLPHVLHELRNRRE